ncbi:MAG: 17 kDa surface antigen [Comamonadaceae bacterium]|nr:MAG: 17 kDa surface antigen [Comamonadaceae bacterium]
MTSVSTPHMPFTRLLFCAMGLLLGASSHAQVWSSGAPAQNNPQSALTRYEADKKLCAQEASPEARIQCRRDAQTIYDNAVASQQPGVYQTQNYGQAVCTDCGRVTAVNVSQQGGSNGTVGMIAGGVAGAVLGHQVGGGFGKDLATIAGAAGGAYAGKTLAESAGSRKIWTVNVQYNDGRTGSFNFDQDPGLTVGTAVKNSGNTLVRN